MTAGAPGYASSFADLDASAVAQVGGKNASPGEMIRSLGPPGGRVPDGFATTARACWHFVDASGLREPIADRLGRLERREAELAEVGPAIRRMVLDAEMPADLAMAITSAYRGRTTRTVGPCGQVPSDRPVFARFLVKAGIDSISVTPDSFLRVKAQVAAAEKDSG
jgi:pyruvate,water dikinase